MPKKQFSFEEKVFVLNELKSKDRGVVAKNFYNLHIERYSLELCKLNKRIRRIERLFTD
jgi:hypothetical protein